MLTTSDPQPLPLEGPAIEYKQAFVENIKKEIAAFLNGDRRAYIYLGINDKSRQVVREFTAGERHQIEETVSHWMSSSIYYPSPVGLVTVHTEASILTIEIKPGERRPYALDDRYYVRNGSESVRASNERVLKLLQSQELNRWDQMPASIQTLHFDYMRMICKRKHVQFKPQALGFFLSDEKTYTNTALLMSDENPFSIKMAVFQGLTVAQFRNRREFVGSLLQQIDEGLVFIDLNNPLQTTITGAPTHIDRQGYPKAALREAYINAVSHRSYFMPAPILVETFDDHMRFMSPGPLPHGMTEQAMLNGLTMPRNPFVVAILHRLNYIENYGTGYRRIYDGYEGETQQPELVLTEDNVALILPNLVYGTVQTAEAGDQLNRKVSRQYMIVAEYLQQHDVVSRAEVEGLLNLKDTMTKRLLKRWQEERLLIRSGVGRSTRYHLPTDEK